ncbi:MAG: xylose isomerase [Calditrichaeota bacterium]|nr:xylose isomerase [Calditrichota bacterium]RQW04305.1 MAG: xylose isomerase [Calditrichota bacterium]
MSEKSFHSICRWTFNTGQGGFVPANIRPSWAPEKLGSTGVIELIRKKIAPRLPEYIILGYELHYDNEVNEKNAREIASVLVDSNMYLAMITPGAHIHFGYGGLASLDEKERDAANKLGKGTVDLVYGPLGKAWFPDEELYPSLVIWNGSFGYDLATLAIQEMYQNLKQNLYELCVYEEEKGAELYIGIEPKPNEGHAAMLLPTVASAIVLWKSLQIEKNLSPSKKGVNKEFGHSEMIGLDHVYDTVEEIDNDMLVHMHVNSQGYNDGILLGGPGKFDIDNGTRINGMNIAIAGLVRKAGYRRWKGHDMQPRPYDNEEQAVDRIIRSILSWEACEQASRKLDEKRLLELLRKRQTARAEDMMREAVQYAQSVFNKMYQG